MKCRETVFKVNSVFMFAFIALFINMLLSGIECVPLFDANNKDSSSSSSNEFKVSSTSKIDESKNEVNNDLNDSNEGFVGDNGSEDEDWQSIQRRKRSGISDQRLAELETLLALKRLRDHRRRIHSPVAFGLFDPDKIGKRRRRSKDVVLFAPKV